MLFRPADEAQATTKKMDATHCIHLFNLTTLRFDKLNAGIPSRNLFSSEQPLPPAIAGCLLTTTH